MFVDLLNLASSVSVIRQVETNDGYGSVSQVTTSTVLAKAAIYRDSARNVLLAGRDARKANFILAYRPSEYTFNRDDKLVSYNGEIYTIVSYVDNVFQKNEVAILPIELIK